MKAIFPGSFDPFTLGHESLVRRGLNLFSEIVVAVGKNSTKTNQFDIEQRAAWIRQVFKDEPGVSVVIYEGLTIHFCQSQGARFILRGLRNSSDFGFERGIGQVNKAMAPEIETVFILSLPEHTAVSSTIIRDIFRNGGDVRPFVPEAVAEGIYHTQPK